MATEEHSLVLDQEVLKSLQQFVSQLKINIHRKEVEKIQREIRDKDERIRELEDYITKLNLQCHMKRHQQELSFSEQNLDAHVEATPETPPKTRSVQS